MNIMNSVNIRNRGLEKEVKIQAMRSSGPGGQNVNKVNTKIELRFKIIDSEILNDSEKQILVTKFNNRINKEGELILTSQTERSQVKNKENVFERFYVLIEKALVRVKKRKATKPTKASNQKRIDTKKVNSEKKKLRKVPEKNI
jgi:ribosome-associated protein